jgi:ribosomal protein S21
MQSRCPRGPCRGQPLANHIAAHCWVAAEIIARMPARIGGGSVGQAAIRPARSGSSGAGRAALSAKSAPPCAARESGDCRNPLTPLAFAPFESNPSPSARFFIARENGDRGIFQPASRQPFKTRELSVRIELEDGETVSSALRRLRDEIDDAYRRPWHKSRPGAFDKPSQRRRKAELMRKRNAILAKYKRIRSPDRATKWLSIGDLYSRDDPFAYKPWPRYRRRRRCGALPARLAALVAKHSVLPDTLAGAVPA